MKTEIITTFPPGLYYVGDLCYLIQDRDQWSAVCNAIANTWCGTVNLPEHGIQAWFSSTKWGDGTYRDQFGREYEVDAGLIGVCAVKDTTPVRGGHILAFDRPFECFGYDSDDWDGEIMIGELRIDTDPECDVDEEEEE
jgi:hypothetical protein